MKYLFLIILSTFTFTTFGAPCNGAPGAVHTNRDGSAGGFIARTAAVSSSVIVDASSSVCEKAKAQGNTRIMNGSEVSGNATIEGNAVMIASKLRGSAKVYGSAVVTNSEVCMGSLVNFSVTGSDYYCPFEDFEPKDPGEAGMKNVLGIDSDVDGVRDDVEIWINNNASNTPNKDMYNVRMALKQVAKNIQLTIQYKDSKEKSIEASNEASYAFDCLEQISSQQEYEQFRGLIQVQVYNTMDRLKAWARNEGHLHGQSRLPARKTVCDFKRR